MRALGRASSRNFFGPEWDTAMSKISFPSSKYPRHLFHSMQNKRAQKKWRAAFANSVGKLKCEVDGRASGWLGGVGERTVEKFTAEMVFCAKHDVRRSQNRHHFSPCLLLQKGWRRTSAAPKCGADDVIWICFWPRARAGPTRHPVS